MADVTPRIGPEAKVVQSYTERGFRISGGEYLGPVLVVEDKVLPFDVRTVADIKPESFAPLEGRDVSYLIIGCAKSAMLDAALLTHLKGQGITAEVMELGAACRTYNVLRTEGRQLAAALIPAGPPE